MKTLKVTLKQHTPLIHFQHDQYGATLRASEVKPKLDKFILERLGDGNYERGILLAKNNQWLIGSGTHPALNYKIRITVEQEVDGMKLKIITRKDSQFTTEIFPLLLANMGGRSKRDDLVNFTMYQVTNLQLTTACLSLYEKLKEEVPYFFAVTNFGQRSNLGYGSYTARIVDGRKINTLSDNPYYIPEGTLYMDFELEDINYLECQRSIFKIIESFWSGLKKFFIKDSSENGKLIRKYLKQNVDGIKVQRIPSPLIFKPISYTNKSGEVKIAVYVLFNKELLDIFSDKRVITYVNNLMDEYLSSIIHPKFDNWRVNTGKDSKIDVQFYEQ